MVAFFNAGFLIVPSIFLFKEAGARLIVPVVVNSKLVLLIAGFGLFANSFGAFSLKSNVQENMNVRSAFFYLFADALVSLAVIFGPLVCISGEASGLIPC